MLNLQRWLVEHTADDLFRAHHSGHVVYVVRKDIKLSECLVSFRKHQIHYLMVRDCECNDIWWLSLDNLLRHLHRHGFEDHVVFEVCPLDAVQCISQSASICEILKSWKGYAWLPPLAITCDDEVVGVLTAADLLHYLYMYEYHLSHLMGKSAIVLECDHEVEKIYKEESAERCLRSLLGPHSKGIVGIVDKKGTLVGSVTLSAFTTMEEDLDMPIIDYVRGIKHDLLPIYFSSIYTFGDVLRRILQTRSHHMWKIDDYGRPVGVIHLSDLIEFIKKQVKPSQVLTCP